MNSSAQYFIGFDGGGTKCKARLEDNQGKLIAEATSGPANAANNLEGSIQSILQATQQVISASGIEGLTPQKIHAGMGLAGLNVPEVMHSFKQQPLPFASASITTDLHTACLGAHKQDDGAIIIIGTGSSGIAIKGNQQFECGGHGFVVGDKGSGAWLGKMAISHSLEVLDGIKPSDKLTTQLMAFLKCNTALELVTLTLNAQSSFYATLAPLIFALAEQNEPHTKYLIKEAAAYINQLSERLFTLSPARFSLIGGVSLKLTPYLAPALQTLIETPLGTPEEGAILYAKHQLACRNKQD